MRAGFLGALGYRLGLFLLWLAPSRTEPTYRPGDSPPTRIPDGQVNRRILSSTKKRPGAANSRGVSPLLGQLKRLLRLVGDACLLRGELPDPVSDRDTSPLGFLLERNRQRVRQADLDLFP